MPVRFILPGVAFYSCHPRMKFPEHRPGTFWRSFVIVLIISAAYALIARLLFPALGHRFNIISVAFIFGMPFALGALVCYLGYRLDSPRPFWHRWAPKLVMLLAVAGSWAVHLEALVCLVVALPIVIPCAAAGGWSMHLSLQKRSKDRLLVSFIVLLPYAMAPVEAWWSTPHETRVMTDSVRIQAGADTIWKQIYQVPAIQSHELPSQWIYHLGFPRPIAATIDREGIGAVRHATFERDVSFFEIVTDWQPLKKLSFTIKADPDFVPRSAFDEHIIVGGRFYDVLNGTYEIEPQSDGSCILHLSSTHRLSTPFNGYAGWWSEWVMSQIQVSILQVIRNRCEAASFPETVRSQS